MGVSLSYDVLLVVDSEKQQDANSHNRKSSKGHRHKLHQRQSWFGFFFLILLFTWINSCPNLHPTRMLHWSPKTSSPNPYLVPWKVSHFPWKDCNWKSSRYEECPLQPEWKLGDAGTSSSCFLHKINYNGQSVLLLSLLGKRWNGWIAIKAKEGLVITMSEAAAEVVFCLLLSYKRKLQRWMKTVATSLQFPQLVQTCLQRSMRSASGSEAERSSITISTWLMIDTNHTPPTKPLHRPKCVGNAGFPKPPCNISDVFPHFNLKKKKKSRLQYPC